MLFGRLFQYGYVVKDLDACIARLKPALGVPKFHIKENGPSSSSTRTGKVVIGDIQLELLEARTDRPTVYDGYIPDDPAGMKFQHFGYYIDTREEYDAIGEWMKEKNIPLAHSAVMPDTLLAAYYDTRPLFGHYFEYVHLMPAAQNWYDDLPRYNLDPKVLALAV